MERNTMYKKYFSLAQSYSTHYLAAQVKQIRHQKVKCKAFEEVLKTRLFPHSPSNNGRKQDK